MLPTDERYKRLTDNQKSLLLTSWLELPSSDQMKLWWDKKEGEPVISKKDSENFKKLGYTSAQIVKMKDQLEKAGFRQGGG